MHLPDRISAGLTISDRTMPLFDGSVKVDAPIDLKTTSTEQIFDEVLHGDSLDIAEMSLATYLILHSRGERRMVGLPIFPSRMFRHGGIYINGKSQITRPQDLIGKRIGVPEFQMTAVVWIRGILQQDYDINPQSIRWVTAGLNTTKGGQRIPLHAAGYDIIHRSDTTLSDMLDAGEIDAIFTASTPRGFRTGNGNIRRLFRDVRAVEVDYFSRYRIFPIMHLIVARRSTLERWPALKSSIFRSFDDARRIALQRAADTNFLTAAIPWQHSEIETTRGIMGDDYWPYGLSTNRDCLETFGKFLLQQKLCADPIDISTAIAGI